MMHLIPNLILINTYTKKSQIEECFEINVRRFGRYSIIECANFCNSGQHEPG